MTKLQLLFFWFLLSAILIKMPHSDSVLINWGSIVFQMIAGIAMIKDLKRK